MEKITIKARKLREIYGYSQEYVAFEMGISQAAYSKKESGRTRFTLECLEKLSVLYRFSLMELISLPAQELLIRAIRNTERLAA